MIGLTHYLVLSAVLLVLGLCIIISKRNAIAILIGVEFILNAANLNFAAFSRYGSDGTGGILGQTAVIFVIVLAAAEAAVALAIFLNFYHLIYSIDVDRGNQLKG